MYIRTLIYYPLLGWEDPLEKGMVAQSSGQRSLVGYSPCGFKTRTRLSD